MDGWFCLPLDYALKGAVLRLCRRSSGSNKRRNNSFSHFQFICMYIILLGAVSKYVALELTGFARKSHNAIPTLTTGQQTIAKGPRM